MRKYQSVAKNLGNILEIDVSKLGQSKPTGYAVKQLNNSASSEELYLAYLAATTPSNPLIRVEGGTLPTGSNLAGTAVATFEIGKYTVTMEEWSSVRCWAINAGFTIRKGVAGGPKHPVTEVSWYDCVKWCNAKSLMEKLEPVYFVKSKDAKPIFYHSGEFGADSSQNVGRWVTNGYRLPTEEEWEWAARGGRHSRGYKFSGSNNLNTVGWHGENSGGITHKVGEKLPNELGIYDMSGNVSEWCWNLDLSNNGRRKRGGECYRWNCHNVSEYDQSRPDDDCDNSLGFRLARSI